MSRLLLRHELLSCSQDPLVIPTDLCLVLPCLGVVCAAVQFHSEYPWIVSASDDQTIRTWNWQSRTCIQRADRPQPLRDVCHVPPQGGPHLLSASLEPKQCGCWDISGLRKKSVAPSGDEMLRLPQVGAATGVPACCCWGDAGADVTGHATAVGVAVFLNCCWCSGGVGAGGADAQSVSVTWVPLLLLAGVIAARGCTVVIWAGE